MNLPTIFKGRLTKRGWILILILISPVLIYVFTFGSNLSQEHDRWAEFGSAMSGIYSPILAVFTLLVLRQQYRLQKQLATHQLNHTRIERSITDFEFFTQRLERYLSTHAGNGVQVGQIIRNSFQPLSLNLLDSDESRENANVLDREFPNVMTTWGAMYPVLMGLEAMDNEAGEEAYLTCKHKLILVLTFEMCVALDNYHHSVTLGALKVKYKFSPLFEKG